MIRPEECDAADCRRPCTGERRVAVKTLEIIEWPFLERLEQERIVLVRRARTQLVPAVRDATLEIRNDAAEMMRDHFQVGKTIHDAGEHQPRKRRSRFER